MSIGMVNAATNPNSLLDDPEQQDMRPRGLLDSGGSEGGGFPATNGFGVNGTYASPISQAISNFAQDMGWNSFQQGFMGVGPMSPGLALAAGLAGHFANNDVTNPSGKAAQNGSDVGFNVAGLAPANTVAGDDAAAMAAAAAAMGDASAPAVGGDPSGIAGLSTGFSDSGTVGGNSDAGGGGGGGGGKMICTELHRQGLMPEDIFLADQAFGLCMIATRPHVYDGYARWARHVVRWMQRDDLVGRTVTKIAHVIGTPWAHEMAHRMGVPVKRSAVGWLLMEGGVLVCGAIGRLTAKPQLEHA